MSKGRIGLIASLMLSLIVSVGILAINIHAQEDNEGQPDEGDIGILAEVASVNMKLVRAFMITQDNGISIGTTAVNAFSPVDVACPSYAPRGCTLRAVVSSQFWSVDAGTVAQVNVAIAGDGGFVEPDSLVNVDSTTTGGLASVRTFQWMKTEIPAAAAQSVTVGFKTNSGDAFAGFRTLTVELYRN